MIDYSNPTMRKLRSLGSAVGVLRPLVRIYRKVFRPAYEESFERAFLDSISAGDTVWDVGANIGHYALLAAARTGPGGKVVAFEPSPRSFSILVDTIKGYSATVISRNIALSDSDGTMPFYLGENSTTDGLKPTAGAPILVEVLRADLIPDQLAPDIIKIDVEGYEWEVIKGAQSLLSRRVPRSIFIEVHFSVLASRGLADAPAAIVRYLIEAGYAVSWIDPSHLRADRAGI